MSSTITNALVAEGRAALRAGDKARARALLSEAVRDAPDNVEAWLWLSGTQTDPQEMASCLHRVLAIDPANQQARDGLAWLAETHGVVVEAPPASNGVPAVKSPDQAPIRSSSRLDAQARPARPAAPPLRQTPRSSYGETGSFALLESALHVAGVGALLGLLRLVGALRPGTLLLVRGSDGPIAPAAALALAAAAALLHAAALLLAWAMLGRSIARARNDRRGDSFDSLVRAGWAFIPGYVAGAALLVAALGLDWSERRWLPGVAVIWVLLLAGGLLVARRVLLLLQSSRIMWDRRALRMARFIGPALLVALAGLALAGTVVEALLRLL